MSRLRLNGMNVETLNPRLLFEIGLLSELKVASENFTSYRIKFKESLSINFTLTIHQIPYHFVMQYPRYFPYQPIQIKAITVFKTSHQYKDGTMCLKWGIDNWSETITGKILIENLIELLTVENPLGETHGQAASGHQFTLLQSVFRQNVTLFVKSTIEKEFPGKKGEGYLVGKSVSDNVAQYLTFFKGWFTLRLRKKTDQKKPKQKKHHLDLENFSYQPYKYCYKRFQYAVKAFSKNKRLFKLDEKYSINMFILKDAILAYYIFKLTEIQQADLIKKVRDNPSNPNYKKSLKALKKLFKSGYTQVYITHDQVEQHARTMIAQANFKKKIVIFGLGSVGSSVLYNLARTGFKNFIIVDGDLFLPNNLSRHVLDISNFGTAKVSALKDKLLNGINPNAKIETFAFALNGQESSKYSNRLLSKIKSADLIIDCSADSNLMFSLNEIIKQQDLPYISGSILSGGIGHVLMKRSKGSPLSLIDLLETQKKFMKLNNINQTHQNNYEAMINERPFIANMSDISMIAGLIGKYATEMLKGLDKLKDDIYFFSTSDDFLGNTFTVQPIIANQVPRNEFSLDSTLIEKGKQIWKLSSRQK